jgi:hypothetical protein
MHAQHGRNYAFFDAPVGLIFTIDRVMEQGSWLDYGMFLQNIMLAAKARGLDTCPRPLLPSIIKLFVSNYSFLKMKCLFVAWLWVTQIRRKWKIRWSLNASLYLRSLNF